MTKKFIIYYNYYTFTIIQFLIEYLKTINILKILYEKLSLINMHVELIIHSNFTFYYIKT
jgi:hypothetical protein